MQAYRPAASRAAALYAATVDLAAHCRAYAVSLPRFAGLVDAAADAAERSALASRRALNIADALPGAVYSGLARGV